MYPATATYYGLRTPTGHQFTTDSWKALLHAVDPASSLTPSFSDFADAVVEVSGRIGTLHEFTSAFERHKVIGILTGSGGIIDEITVILEKAGRGMGRVVMDDDPRA